MDLLEYQGKQLFARHGVPVPTGAPATTVEEAVAAADELGYPCVVKAQVQIGGRGKAGGIKLANDRDEAEEHATRDPRHGHPRPHGPRGLGRAGVRHRRRVLRLVRLRPRRQEAARDALDAGRHGHRGGRRARPRTRSRGCTSTRCSASRTSTRRRLAFEAGVDADVIRAVGALLAKLYDAFVAEDAMLVEVNPLIVTADREVAALDAKVTLDDNALFRHPENAELRDVSRRGPAGADGARARPDLREARRRRRHPRQRRRARDVHARRRRPGGRRARPTSSTSAAARRPRRSPARSR